MLVRKATILIARLVIPVLRGSMVEASAVVRVTETSTTIIQSSSVKKCRSL